MVDTYSVSVDVKTQSGVDFWRLARWTTTEVRKVLSEGRRIRRFEGLSVSTDDGRRYKRSSVDEIEVVMTDHHAVPTSLYDFVPSQARNTEDLFATIMLHYNQYADRYELQVDFSGRDRLAVQRIATKFYGVARGLALAEIAPESSAILHEGRMRSADEPSRVSRAKGLLAINKTARAFLIPVLIIIVAAIALGVLRACGVPVAV